MPLIITSGLGRQESTSTTPTVTTVTAGLNYIDIVFSAIMTPSSNVFLASSWSITSSGMAHLMSVNAITQTDSYTLRLTTTEATHGGSYVLHIPTVGILDSLGNPFYGPYERAFTGVGTTPSVLMVRATDARTLEVYFSEAVNEGDALNTANYSINNGLQVTGAAKLSPSHYQLKTTKQTEGVTYTVTVTNVRDAQDN